MSARRAGLSGQFRSKRSHVPLPAKGWQRQRAVVKALWAGTGEPSATFWNKGATDGFFVADGKKRNRSKVSFAPAWPARSLSISQTRVNILNKGKSLEREWLQALAWWCG